MKKRLIKMALSVLMMVCVSACSGNAETVDENHDSSAIISESEDIEAESTEETILSEDSETYRTEEVDNQAAENNTSFDETDIGETTMIMKIGDTKVNVDWEDNQAVEALRNMAEDGDVTIQMSMYGGFEQVGSIGQSLPRDDKQTTTSSGDVVLYSGNQMVVFYGSNSWSYTRLGHISDKNAEDITDLLSNGDVTITISIE
ncbi:cyclophilin-like fold protein [Butyrivibrio sp. AE2015]|uniref:cyclophilin-like fold protein n=1 Tax=Butyrivibrio sp. AE2015 TaxID=1280663 RepID=UPI0003B5D5EE|nr:cyclophilin-like fold protein [Butyrivibrio sp. AE2015]